MKKFLAILFSVVVTLGAITVLGANVNDPYEFDGDVITNPFWWLYTTEAPETETEPTTVGANWVLVGQNSNNNYYYDKANMTVNEVVSIQQPGWASELGIYLNVSEAITSVTVNGVSQNVASIDGAGAVVYLSALTQDVNEVIVKYGNNTAKVLFKKEALSETEAPTEKPTEAPTEAPTEKPTVAPVELKITSQPQDVMVKAGTTANFNIKAQGEGLKYQWQVSSSNGERWGNTSLAGNKTTTLTLTAAANYDGRLYRCIVTDKYGKTVTSNAAKLSIEKSQATLKITGQPQDVKAEVGSTTSVSVKAEGEGLKYQWQVSSSNGERWGNTSLAGNKTTTLTFTVLSNYEGRLFRCIVTDKNGKTVTSNAAKVSLGSLQTELKIVKQPEDVKAQAGNTVTFKVKAQGTGLTYQWQTSSSNGAKWGNTSLAGNKTATLSFTAPANYDGRLYRCIITDANGNTVTSDAAKLSFGSITGTVKITSQPTDVKASVGKIVSFKVVAEGVGLKYQWQTSSSNGAKWGNTSLSGNNTALLSFSAPATYDGRLYRCVITDAKGNTVVSEAAKLSIGEATGDPIIINAQPKDVSVAAGSATSFIVEATGEGLTYQWQVSSSNGERWGNTSLAGAKTNILQLVAPSNYNGRLYRCVITDKNGNTVITDAAKLTVR
ncbi:hypothetical protein [Eubacterium sp.]|uniref:PT domain-containing protein n=1 Tax=Eubacterium sp. TaxID=142586 RepID=UPI0035223728